MLVVVAPPSKVAKPVKLDTPETVKAPVRAIVPSVALVIVSPFKSVSEVVVAPPRNVLKPVTESVLAADTAPVNVEAPVTVNVPPVLTLVLMVVAAEAVITIRAIKNKTETKIKENLCVFAFIYLQVK